MLMHAEDVLNPSRVARLAARLHATKLDRELIEGADPSTSQQLAARAAQLTSRPTRNAIADGLERLLRGASGYGTRTQVPVARRAVNANAAERADLADVVRSDAVLYAQGLAILREMVADGAGPAYLAGAAEPLTRALASARAAL